MSVQQLERECVGKITFPHRVKHGLSPAAGISSTIQHASTLYCSDPLKITYALRSYVRSPANADIRSDTINDSPTQAYEQLHLPRLHACLQI